MPKLLPHPRVHHAKIAIFYGKPSDNIVYAVPPGAKRVRKPLQRISLACHLFHIFSDAIMLVKEMVKYSWTEGTFAKRLVKWGRKKGNKQAARQLFRASKRRSGSLG